MSERLVPRLPIELQIQVVQNASADQLRSLSLVSKAFWGKAAPRLWCQISGASVIALITEFHIKREFEERWDIRDNFESHREAMPAEIDIKQIKRFQTVYAPMIRKPIIGDSTILNKQVLKYLVERATDTQATPLLPNLEVLLILATNLKPEVTGHIAPWSDNEHGLPLNGPNLFYSDLEDLTLLFLSPSVHTLAAYCDSHGAITPHRILELAPNLRDLRIEFHTYPDRYGHRPKTLSLCYQALPESLAEVWHTGIDKRYSEFSWPRGIAENLLRWTQLSSLTLHCQFFERLTIFTLARLPLLTNLVLLGAFDRYDWQNHDSEADEFCALRDLTLRGADASTAHKFFRCTSLMQLLETVYWAPADDVCGLGRGLAADNYRDVIVDLVGAVPGLKRLGLNIRDRAVFEGLGLANDLAGLLDLSSLHIDNHPTNHDLAIPFLLVAG